MEQNVKAMECQTQAGSFATKVGRTTYVVGVFFNDKAKASYDDKAKKLMMSDLKAGNF